MKSAQLQTYLLLAAVAVLLSTGSNAVAQADAEDELEIIRVGDGYEDDEDAADAASPGDLVYDEESGQYRLLEVPEDDDPQEFESERERDIAEIGRLFALYKESLATENYLEADALAKQIVVLTIKVYDVNSLESAKALTNLAIAQHNNKEYEAAETNYRTSIGIIEQTTDRLNVALINPLKGLAATQLAIGQPDTARATFQRAVHVSHVNEGPHNKDQIEVLESIAEIYLAVGDHKGAVDIQERMFAIESRNLGQDSIDVVPALQNQADWQHRLQLYDRERVTWRRIISVIENHYGKEDLRLIPPLTSLGKSYLYVTPVEYDMQPEVSVASGETYLRRAQRIADVNPDSTWHIQEQTMLALGDYYVLSGRSSRASKVYTDLWEMLSGDEEQLRSRREHLEELNLLQNIYPPKYYRSESIEEGFPDEEEYETGTVSFGFIVDSSGRPSNVEHIETRPPEFEDMRERVRRNMRYLVYRPRIKDGQLVATPDNVYTHEFFYRPGDIPVQQAEMDSASQ